MLDFNVKCDVVNQCEDQVLTGNVDGFNTVVTDETDYSNDVVITNELNKSVYDDANDISFRGENIPVGLCI